MGWFNKTENEGSIHWKELKNLEDLETWNDMSFQKPVIFFKHSTRCSISSMAKSRFERGWSYTDEEITPVYLDLIQYRDISNHLASFYGVHHESPQVLLIREGKCVYNASHSSINASSISSFLK